MTVINSPNRGHARRALLVVLALATSLQAIGAASAQSDMARKIGSPPAPQADVPDGFTVAAVGDTICHFPISGYVKARTPKMIDILKGADVTIGNFETTTIDFNTYTGSPQAEAGGSWLITKPGVPQDMADMGFDLMSRANNHSTDWGVEGMKMTDAFLDKAGLVHAGTGVNLGAASAARFLEGRTFGRMAFVSFASSFETMSPALDMFGEVPGRAGMNALHTTQIVQVSPEQIATLKEVATVAAGRALPGADVTMGDTVFRGTPGITKPISSYTMLPADVQRITRNIRDGKFGSAFEAVYMHAHQGGASAAEPADFMPKIAHQSIDAGADAFFASGPHQVRGIEIYKGKPIFYSLGNFCHMDDAQLPQPQQLWDQLAGGDSGGVPLSDLMRYWVDASFGRQELLESVIAVSKFVGGNVSEIRLYPIWLGRGGRRQLMGMPLLATPAQGKAVLERIARLSEPFGTRIVIENNVGIIRVAATR